MRELAKKLATIALVVVLFAPAPAFAQFDEAGFSLFSFGGRVASINYCLHGAINIIIIPAGVFPISYVWGLPPTTISIPPAPPISIGQQVLGLAFPAFIPCVGFGTHPPIWYGFQVIYGGASPPSPSSFFGF